MWPGMRPHGGCQGPTPFLVRCHRVRDFMAGASSTPSVAGDTDDFIARRGGAPLRPVARLGRFGFGSPGGCGLGLGRSSEEKIGEGAVHRFGHDYGEDEPGGAVEAPAMMRSLFWRRIPWRRGEPGIAVNKRDDGGHVGAADGDDQENSEDERDADDQREAIVLASGCRTRCKRRCRWRRLAAGS